MQKYRLRISFQAGKSEHVKRMFQRRLFEGIVCLQHVDQKEDKPKRTGQVILPYSNTKDLCCCFIRCIRIKTDV